MDYLPQRSHRQRFGPASSTRWSPLWQHSLQTGSQSYTQVNPNILVSLHTRTYRPSEPHIPGQWHQLRRLPSCWPSSVGRTCSPWPRHAGAMGRSTDGSMQCLMYVFTNKNDGQALCCCQKRWAPSICSHQHRVLQKKGSF